MLQCNLLFAVAIALPESDKRANNNAAPDAFLRSKVELLDFNLGPGMLLPTGIRYGWLADHRIRAHYSSLHPIVLVRT